MKKILILATLLIMSATSVHAGVGGFVRAGLTAGGDEVVFAYDLYTGNQYSWDISDAAFIEGGVFLRKSDFELLLVTGVHVGSVKERNVEATLTKIPFEVIGCYYLNDYVRVGAGLTLHTGITYTVSDGANEYTEQSDNALGSVAVVDIMLRPNQERNLAFSIGLKFTAIEYVDSGGNIRDGSSTGIVAGVYF